MTEPRGHLSDEQLDDILIGAAEQATLEHAEACDRCTARLEEFRGALGEFNEASRLWSEARAHGMPPIVPASGIRGWLGRGAPWSYAAASVAALALVVAGGVHSRGGSAASPSASSAGADYFSSRQQEIATDNAMLSEISTELYRPVTIPETLYPTPRTRPSDGGLSRQVRN